MKFDFTDKVVLVTGASGSIGSSISKHFAEAGAKVIFHYNKNKKNAFKQFSELSGNSHMLIQVDITNQNSIESTIDLVIQKMGKIDILVNSAGIYIEHDIDKLSYDEWIVAWDKTFKVNLFGHVNLLYYVIRQMRKQNGGKIVNVSSQAAFCGDTLAPAYGASKSAFNSFSQSLAKALAMHNIYVYVVAPGFVEKERSELNHDKVKEETRETQSPLKRIAKIDEVVKTVLFLASDGLDYLSGCIVDINGASYLRS